MSSFRAHRTKPTTFSNLSIVNRMMPRIESAPNVSMPVALLRGGGERQLLQSYAIGWKMYGFGTFYSGASGFLGRKRMLKLHDSISAASKKKRSSIPIVCDIFGIRPDTCSGRPAPPWNRRVLGMQGQLVGKAQVQQFRKA